MARKQDAPQVQRIRVASGMVMVAVPNGEYLVGRFERPFGDIEIVIAQEGPKIYEGGEA